MSNRVSFRGRLGFCSNFYRRPVVVDGVKYRTREHAFQAQKFLDPKIREYIREQEDPGRAKRAAYQFKEFKRSDWEDISLVVMENVVWAFFEQWPDMQTRLLNTGDEHLEEQNTWGDTFWGTDQNGVGFNHLGKTLMTVRKRLQNRTKNK